MDRFFGLDKVAYHDRGLAFLTTVHDNVELAIIRSILEGENIPFLYKRRGKGNCGIFHVRNGRVCAGGTAGDSQGVDYA